MPAERKICQGEEGVGSRRADQIQCFVSSLVNLTAMQKPIFFIGSTVLRFYHNLSSRCIDYLYKIRNIRLWVTSNYKLHMSLLFCLI